MRLDNIRPSLYQTKQGVDKRLDMAPSVALITDYLVYSDQLLLLSELLRTQNRRVKIFPTASD